MPAILIIKLVSLAILIFTLAVLERPGLMILHYFYFHDDSFIILMACSKIKVLIQKILEH